VYYIEKKLFIEKNLFSQKILTFILDLLKK